MSILIATTLWMFKALWGFGIAWRTAVFVDIFVLCCLMGGL